LSIPEVVSVLALIESESVKGGMGFGMGFGVGDSDPFWAFAVSSIQVVERQDRPLNP